MQVSLTAVGGLERKLEVAVAAEKVAAEVTQRLKTLSRTARLKGFRPGKAPFPVIQKQYGSQVHAEVVGDLMRSSFADAVSQEKLKPATSPKIQPVAIEPGQDLKYIATFEVLPDLKLADVEQLAIERPTATVTDADLEAMLETLQKQRPIFNVVEREAKDTDRVTVDFQGLVDGAPFQGGEGKDVKVAVGEGQVMPEFEAAIRGARVGEKREATINFPADHASKELAGKTAIFTIELKQVEERTLPVLDDTFATEFGIKEGGVAALRDEVRKSMERELENEIRNQVRTQVMDALVRANPIDVPRGLVEETAQEMQLDMGRRMGAKDMSQLPQKDLFDEPARRRVALGLIVSELLRTIDLKVDRARVQGRLEELVSSYPNADDMRRAYLQNADAMRQVESSVLEEQLVEWVLGRARVTERSSNFKELTRFGQNA